MNLSGKANHPAVVYVRFPSTATLITQATAALCIEYKSFPRSKIRYLKNAGFTVEQKLSKTWKQDASIAEAVKALAVLDK